MFSKDVYNKMIANWKAEGEPYCPECRQPIMGKKNMAFLKKYKICSGCYDSIRKARDNQWQSVPPLGIRKE